MPHPFHKHLLTLSNSQHMFGYSCCNACHRSYQGFSYRCYKGDCSFEIDIQCILLSDTLKHPSHEHSLFIVHSNEGMICNACSVLRYPWHVAYRCMKRCDFILDVGCATLPLTAWYKYDRHPLTLTYSDDSEPSQHYCDLCEKERNPNRWFYYCADCDNSLHLNCAIGDLPYMKLGIRFNNYRHEHPLTVVKNIWNCPPCKVCGEICNGQALECKESECKFFVH
ncbi:tRNA 5-methylaminomethyl-2-thiouridine biosynthesis bifunctional MnmC [Gossypium arboreum]|uniref:tRNA 5-methylaminomethyl-2-thiouridine biosynthesis bifunctional MnmC n=2 Tax=Gossypium arboreum TaxID=29729 RepID=A0A0B0PA87_GOSAR|nr:tRNA 5-methylaminomethyl-2-thiouridine biosynthesis bifunctional MnmC [Gossypium arboreum]